MLNTWMYHSIDEWKHSLFGMENIFSLQDDSFSAQLKEHFLEDNLSRRCYILIEPETKAEGSIKVEVWKKNQIADNIFQIFFFKEPLKYLEDVGLWKWDITSDIPNMELLGTYFMDSGIFYSKFSIKSQAFTKMMMSGTNWIDEDASSYVNFHEFEKKIESILMEEFYNMYPTYNSLPSDLQKKISESFLAWAEKEKEKLKQMKESQTHGHMDIIESHFLPKDDLFSSHLVIEKIEYLEYVDAKKRKCEEDEKEIIKNLSDRNKKCIFDIFAKKMFIEKLKLDTESKLSELESLYLSTCHKL